MPIIDTATATDGQWYAPCSVTTAEDPDMHKTMSMGVIALLLVAPLSVGCGKPRDSARDQQAAVRAEEAARRAEAAAGRTEAAAQRAETAAERAERILARQGY